MPYLAGTAAVILLGLASRRYPGLFPQAWGKYPGDALWTLMVFLGLRGLLPGRPAVRVAAYALAVSFMVEGSQLYHAPWLDAVRHTTLGHLVLGSGFDRFDLLAYAAGACIGLGLEKSIRLIAHRAWAKRVTPAALPAK